MPSTGIAPDKDTISLDTVGVGLDTEDAATALPLAGQNAATATGGGDRNADNDGRQEKKIRVILCCDSRVGLHFHSRWLFRGVGRCRTPN